MKTPLYHTINKTAFILGLSAIDMSFRKHVELLQLGNHASMLHNWRAVMADYHRLEVTCVISQVNSAGPAQRRVTRKYLSHQH